MYLSIPSSTYAEILRVAKLAIHPRAPLPVLSSLLFRIRPEDPRTVEITTTNLDMAIHQSIRLEEPGGPGAACIPLSSLTAIKPDRKTPVRIDHAPHIRSFDAQAQDIQILYVTGGQSASAETDSIPADEFPPLEAPPPEAFTCLLPTKTVAALIDSIPFQSEDETRYVLNGVYLDASQGGSVVATDGRVLARWTTKVTPESVILPTAACKALVRLGVSSATACLEPVKKATARILHIRHGRTIISTRLIEGNFPNYRQVIPTEENQSTITMADAPGVAKWLATLGESAVTITPRAPHYVDFSHANGRITATAYLGGEPPAVAFNPQYLAAALDRIGGTMFLIDGMCPCTVRNPAGNLAVVMPMRVTTPAATPAPAVRKTRAAASA